VLIDNVLRVAEFCAFHRENIFISLARHIHRKHHAKTYK